VVLRCSDVVVFLQSKSDVVFAVMFLLCKNDVASQWCRNSIQEMNAITDEKRQAS